MPEMSSTILIGAVALFFIIALCFITQAIVDDDDDDTPSSGGGTTTVIEREKVLVVCPYCGHKNDQGTSECSNCDGAL